mgnify:CR=1 FL=1
MQVVSNSRNLRTECHWEARAVATEHQLSSASTCRLRAIYSELLGHYRRMARLHDVGAPGAKGF